MPGAIGNTAKDMSTVTTITAGARTKTALSANGGIQSSLKKILIMSATPWRDQKGPAAVGPFRALPQRQKPAFEPDQPGRKRECPRQNPNDGEDGIRTGHGTLEILLQTGRSRPANRGVPAGTPA